MLYFCPITRDQSKTLWRKGACCTQFTLTQFKHKSNRGESNEDLWRLSEKCPSDGNYLALYRKVQLKIERNYSWYTVFVSLYWPGHYRNGWSWRWWAGRGWMGYRNDRQGWKKHKQAAEQFTQTTAESLLTHLPVPLTAELIYTLAHQDTEAVLTQT